MSFEAPCLQAGVPELSVTDAWTEIAFGDVPKLHFVLVWNCAKAHTLKLTHNEIQIG